MATKSSQLDLRDSPPFIQQSSPVSGTNVILEITGVTLWCSTGDKFQERGRALQEAIMYRFLFRTVYTARKSSVRIYEACVLPAKCDKAAVFRFANGGGVKALSTCSVRLCEKKDNVASSIEEEKTLAEKPVDPTETPTLVTQKAEDDSKVIQREEEPVVLKTEDEGTTQQQVDVKTEQVEATPAEVKTVAAKSGKDSLLDILGGMTVLVTSKRKLRNLKAWQSEDFTTKSKPAAMESTISMFQKATEEASSQSETLDPQLVAAVSAAASTLPDSSQATSELLRQLRQQQTVTEAQKKGDMNILGDIITDMKVRKNPNRRQTTRPANQIQFDDDGPGYTYIKGIDREPYNSRNRKTYISRKRLNIFPGTTDTDKDGVESAVVRPTLWDIVLANDLSLSTEQTHRNGLEEMIQWTKEGRMWQYPINNEAGLEEEASVPFHEHIFLEEHLQEGFPRQGPVRHFMELVVAGLSKNPYLTVQQKRDHISWFRDYFHQKEDVLKEAEVYLN
ncbi:28S ribosomal protein S31, mitochondrial [Gymnodraco acuticeps]|uniref:Small ribosomal subunit protein mS31 n=1 Tax=Gymnodraco acuticeps TaxID=8218 RepID=A0A6P8VYW2_GYMAC|nr:28S ribosomal protein S31, mitochondrial [Gymnodraco acuticeps]